MLVSHALCLWVHSNSVNSTELLTRRHEATIRYRKMLERCVCHEVSSSVACSS